MNSHSDFVVGKQYLVASSPTDIHQCIAYDIDGRAVIQRLSGSKSVFTVTFPEKWSEYVKPPVITKTYVNLYVGSVSTQYTALHDARIGALSGVLGQLEYTYKDGVVTDVAFIKQIGN